MLDDHPILKERLMALGAFVGIGVFAVAAVDVMVTGGFDFGRGRATHEQPDASVRAADDADYVSDSFGAWSGTLFSRPPDTSVSEERLIGAEDGSAPIGESSGENLYDEIAALYERSEGAEALSYEDAPAYDPEAAEPVYEDEGYEEPAYEGEYADEANRIASAYENASPW